MAWYDKYLSDVYPDAAKTDDGKDRYKAAFFRNMTYFKILFKAGKKWILPPETQKRMIYGDTVENLLFDNEYLAFFNDDATDDLMCLPVEGVGSIDVYGNFEKYRTVGVATGFNRTFDRSECVVLSNFANVNTGLEQTYTGTPALYLGSICAQLAAAEVSERCNVEQQFNPWVLTGAADEEPTLVKVKNGLKNFAQFIFKRKANDDGRNVIEPLHLDVPFIGRELQAYRTERTSEALTYLGYHSLPIDKSERLVVSEVESRDAVAVAMFQSQEYARKRACAEVKEKLGKDINFMWEREVNANADYRPELGQDGRGDRAESGESEREGAESA